MTKRIRIWLGWVLLIGSLIGWPASVIWWARDEPPFVLSLSWLALTLTALDILFTAQVGKEVDEQEATMNRIGPRGGV
jgi:hypothetical protein